MPLPLAVRDRIDGRLRYVGRWALSFSDRALRDIRYGTAALGRNVAPNAASKPTDIVDSHDVDSRAGRACGLDVGRGGPSFRVGLGGGAAQLAGVCVGEWVSWVALHEASRRSPSSEAEPGSAV